MIDLLSSANVSVLEDFARSNVLLAFDFDGTLAPIVGDPDCVDIRPRTRALLSSVAGVYPVTVISGRSRADVARRLHGIGVASVIGNHGLERWHLTDAGAGDVHRWLPSLEAAVASLKGVTIENKTFSIALHYRRSRQKKEARGRILAAARTIPGARIISGKQVVNVLPVDAPHKGIALERERARLGCDTAIYVGDDKADEDVFALDQPGRLLCVRIGRDRHSSAAAYFISDQRAVDELLRILVASRRGVVRERRAL